MFRQVADRALGAFGLIEQIDAVHVNATGARREVAGDELHGGGLACAVGSEEPQHIALGQLETHVIDGQGVAVVTGQVFCVYQRVLLHG